MSSDLTNDLVTITEAVARSGLSRTTLWRRLKSGELTAWTNPRDKRQTLLDYTQLEQQLTPYQRVGVRHERVSSAIE